MQPVRQVGQAHHLSAEMCRQLLATLQGAVGNHDGMGLARSKVGGAQLDHLAGTHKQQPYLAEILKQLAGQPNGGCRHADRMGADLGGRSNLFGDRKRALEQLAQRGAQRAGLFGGTHGILELPQDLWLAQHHGIQPAGHSKGVAGGHPVLQCVGVRAQERWRHATRVGKPVEGGLQFGVFTGAIDLGTVAGGDDGSFRLPGKGLAQAMQGGLYLFCGERKPAAQVERRSGVIDAQGPDCHIALFGRIIKSQGPWAFSTSSTIC